MARILLLLLAGLLVWAGPARADTLHVFGAGSLTDAFSDLLRRFPSDADTVAPAEFGPSGLLTAKIEAGAPADLFASADMEHARQLAIGHPERTVIHFTRNRLCALARAAVGLTRDNMVERLLDPTVRVATSTPGADPGGDYAWAIFARADALHPRARASLEAKALPLVGGGEKTPNLIPGKGAVEGVFFANRADVMLGYCSSEVALMRAVPGLVSVSVPEALSANPAYGMVLLNTKPVTLRFAAFVMSEGGQSVLQSHGFNPTAFIEPAAPLKGLLVARGGQQARVISPEILAGLRSIQQRVAIEHDEREWSGPSLWDVLVAATAVDPTKPAEQVRLSVRVTGADGWTATFGMAELSPQFLARPVQLATKMNGEPITGTGMRLIAPGEQRGGRSVRDVVRVDIN